MARGRCGLGHQFVWCTLGCQKSRQTQRAESFWQVSRLSDACLANEVFYSDIFPAFLKKNLTVDVRHTAPDGSGARPFVVHQTAMFDDTLYHMLHFLTIPEAIGLMGACQQLRSIVRGTIRTRVFSVFGSFFSLVQLRFILKTLAAVGGCFFGAAPALVLSAHFDRPLGAIDTLHIALLCSTVDRLSDFVLHQLAGLDPSREEWAFVGRHCVSLAYQEKVGFRCVAEFRCLVRVSPSSYNY